VPDWQITTSQYKKAIWRTHKAVRTVKRKHNLFRTYRDINNHKYIKAVQMARTETRRAKINIEK